MITLTNFASGEIQVAGESGESVRLSRDQANRLVMHARMHSVAEFVAELRSLLESPALQTALLTHFERLATPTDRWNFKEKFARLRTLTREAPAGNSDEVVEKVTL